MTNHARHNRLRTRTVLGGVVIAVALGAAGVLGGVGLAGNSVSAAQSQYGKITICHKTHSIKNPFVTITVSLSAWPAHRRHGDTVGACTKTTTSTSTTAIAAPVTSSHGKGGTHGKSGAHGNGHHK